MSNNKKILSPIELIKKINFINSEIKYMKFLLQGCQKEISNVNDTLTNLNKKIRNENTIFSFFLKNSVTKKKYQEHKIFQQKYIIELNKKIDDNESIIKSLIKMRDDVVEELVRLNKKYYEKYISLIGKENNKNYYEKFNEINNK